MKDKKLSELQPRAETWINAVLNGILNGITVGSAPLGYFSLRKLFAHKEIPHGVMKFSAIASIIGAGLGTVWGVKEAQRITKYRGELSGQVEDLKHDMAKLKADYAAVTQSPMRAGKQDMHVSSVQLDGKLQDTLERDASVAL